VHIGRRQGRDVEPRRLAKAPLTGPTAPFPVGALQHAAGLFSTLQESLGAPPSVPRSFMTSITGAAMATVARERMLAKAKNFILTERGWMMGW